MPECWNGIQCSLRTSSLGVRIPLPVPNVGAYSSKDGGRSVKPLPFGWLGSIPRAPTKYVEVNPTVWMLVCETRSLSSTLRSQPKYGRVAKWLRRQAHTLKIGGSNPLSATRCVCGEIGYVGSSPTLHISILLKRADTYFSHAKFPSTK